MLKCWVGFPGNKQFLIDQRHSFQVEGWGGFVLKEKLNLIKGCMEIWHKNHTKNLEGKMKNMKDRISSLDSRVEEEDVEGLQSLSANLFSIAKTYTSMYWQKSCLNLLKQGDANSKFFLRIMSTRRRLNSIISLNLNDDEVDGVVHFCATMFDHFANHFKASKMVPRVDNLNFKTLNGVERGETIKPFNEEEINIACGIVIALLRAFRLRLKAM